MSRVLAVGSREHRLYGLYLRAAILRTHSRASSSITHLARAPGAHSWARLGPAEGKLVPMRALQPTPVHTKVRDTPPPGRAGDSV